MELFYEIVDSFVLDMCSKLIFCSKIALLNGVTRTSKSCAPKAKSCLKVAEHNQDRAGDTSPVSSGLGQSLIHTLNFLVTLSSL